MLESRIARDREEFPVCSNGGDWLTAWHPPVEAPAGTPHGANGFCVTVDDRVVLISNDARRWGWPGGRPEADESWKPTLRPRFWKRRVASFARRDSSGSAVVDASLVRRKASSLCVPFGGQKLI